MSPVVARHETNIMGKNFLFFLNAPDGTNRRQVSEGLAAAVAELRAVEYTFSPLREESLVSMLRRDELRPDAYPPPLADVVRRCTDLRTATEGWFDAWAAPGGFDPGGMVTGWGIERAAALLRAAGISSYSISGGGDTLVRGRAPDGEPWRVDIHDTVLELTDGAVATCAPARARVVNPHTGEVVVSTGTAYVTGPDLCVADAYATALYAAGPVGLGWFPTTDGYSGFLIDDDRPVRPSLPVGPTASDAAAETLPAAPVSPVTALPTQTTVAARHQNVSPARAPRPRTVTSLS